MDFIKKEISDYANLFTEKESEILKNLNRETWKNVLQPRMLSGHLQGKLLSTISKMITPSKIIEIGTYTGYSALCLAEGLNKSGILHTIDCNEEYISVAKKYFIKSKFRKNIKQFYGNAIEIIPKLKHKYQLAFIDADKENYSNYYDLLFDKIELGGYLIADNVLWSGKVLNEAKDKDTIAIQKFNKKIYNDKKIETLLLPIRDGIMIGKKIAN